MDERFMQRAIELALENVRSGRGGPFGALIVKDGAIISEGTNRVTSTNDPTAHAEITAIREACKKLGTFQLDGCELYTSCEPCPMCLAAIYWARVDRIYYGNDRHDAARIGFDDELLYREIALPPEARSLDMRQMLSDEARETFDAWERKPDKTPY